MPRKSHGDSHKGQGAGPGGWQVDNVNRLHDKRRVLPKPGDRRVNKASRQAHRSDARATRKNERARTQAKGGCAVTALSVGGAVATLVATWKGGA